MAVSDIDELLGRMDQKHPNGTGCSDQQCGWLPTCAGNAGRLPPVTGNAPAIAFDLEYERLSRQGACDTPGGAEFERVKAEWLEAGKPEIEPFIRERANIGPFPS